LCEPAAANNQVLPASLIAMPKLLACLALGASLLAPPLALLSTAHAATNLLSNGSFEQPGGCLVGCVLPGASTAVAGWTTFLSGVEYVDPLAFGTGPAPDGLLAVDLANYVYPEGGGILQAFDTVAGELYALSFWAGNARFAGRDGSGTVHVQVGDLDAVIDTPLAVSGQGVWALQQFSFTALSDRTELRLSNTQDPLVHYALVDDVRVMAVPEVPTVLLALAGLALLRLQRRP
jgi:hypothetical protein